MRLAEQSSISTSDNIRARNARNATYILTNYTMFECSDSGDTQPVLCTTQVGLYLNSHITEDLLLALKHLLT